MTGGAGAQGQVVCVWGGGRVFPCVYLYVCMFVCLCGYLCMFEGGHVCVNIWVSVWVFVCLCVCVGVCMFVCQDARDRVLTVHSLCAHPSPLVPRR